MKKANTNISLRTYVHVHLIFRDISYTINMKIILKRNKLMSIIISKVSISFIHQLMPWAK